MSADRIWKMGTLVFGATTLVLTAVLISGHLRPERIVRVETVPLRTPSAAARGESPPTRGRTRVAPTGSRTADDVTPDDGVRAPWRSTLAPERDLREILADHVFDRDGEHVVRAPRDALLRRLRSDEDRSVRLLESWIGRLEELQESGVGLTGSPPELLCVYAALRGRAAIPLLRTCDRSAPDAIDWRVALPLVAAGDAAAAERIDRQQRATTGNNFVSPEQVVSAGGAAVDLVRTWIGDDVSNPALREHAARSLFEHGTEDDRSRLWETTPADARLRLFYAPSSEHWSERLRQLTTSSLDDADPWVRVHAALRVRWDHDTFLPEVVARALEIAITDLSLPCPGGRPAERWVEVRAALRLWQVAVRARADADRKWSEVLGDE